MKAESVQNSFRVDVKTIHADSLSTVLVQE